jgi:hypothetical protein
MGYKHVTLSCVITRRIRLNQIFLDLLMYQVFYHNLLIPKLHDIAYKNYTDGIHISKDWLHGFQNI